MLKKIFFTIFIIVFFTNCSEKMTVTTYSDIKVPLYQLENVNITIEGSSIFIENINSFLPSEFNDIEILKDDPNSPYILHIIENSLQTSSKTYETREEKTVQYVTYVFDSQQNKTIPVVQTKDIIYFQKCLVTDYTLSATVTTRYKRDIVSATVQNEKCHKRRSNLFYDNNLQATNNSYFYNNLVDKLTFNIKNYLIPHYTSYSVDIDEDIDIEMSSLDEENYENIIEMLGDGIYSDEILYQLVKLHNSYPNSYSLNYNIGLVYEYLAQNKNALFYYKKCLEIKTTKDIIQRIESIKNNIRNEEKVIL